MVEAEIRNIDDILQGWSQRQGRSMGSSQISKIKQQLCGQAKEIMCEKLDPKDICIM
jgi:hypothetical protein